MKLRAMFGLVCVLSGTAGRALAQSVAEQYLFAWANAERAQRGVAPLRWEVALYYAAVGHAGQMATRGNISHQYQGEPDVAERARAAGAKFSVISENVAEASTAVRIHDAWMNSPGHRENLLDPRVDAVGISVVRRNGQLYAVQDFERSVEALTLEQQEAAVAKLVAGSGRIEVVTPHHSSATDVRDGERLCGIASARLGDPLHRSRCSDVAGSASGESSPAERIGRPQWVLARRAAASLFRLITLP